MKISVDFETRSQIDLRAYGVYKYLEHPTTDVICMAYAVDDEEPRVWYRGEAFPKFGITRGDLWDSKVEFRSWNAMFERLVWKMLLVPKHGAFDIMDDLWHCTAAEAAAMSLPRSLEGVADLLQLDNRKDMGGNKLVAKMSRPRKVNPDGTIQWHEDEADLNALGLYCAQDVRVEREAKHHIRDLSPVEREVYLLNQRLNDRGIAVDLPLVAAGKVIVAEGVRRATEELIAVTSGAVTSVTKPAQLRVFTGMASVGKAAVRDALAVPQALSEEQERALELRAEVGRSSVAKLDVFERVTGDDGRVRGLLLYHGANTGRDSHKLVQAGNFPRPDPGLKPEHFLDDVMRGDYDTIDLFHPPVGVVAGLLRGCLVASPGMVMCVGDFAQVEARVLAWQAGQEDLLVEYRKPKPRVYEQMAAGLFGCSLEDIIAEGKDSVKRQRGKDTELGCGYQMGKKTFRKQLMEKSGVDVGEAFAEKAVATYRAMRRNVVQYWRDVEDAAIQACKMPGKDIIVAGNAFRKTGGYLTLRLKSGRYLWYPRPKLEVKQTPWGSEKLAVTAEGENSITHQWQRYSLYGGHITENIVQALSRDLMWAAGLRLDRAGYAVLCTVHDELVTEIAKGQSNVADFERIMAQVPKWAEGCPIAVEAFEAKRYRK